MSAMTLGYQVATLDCAPQLQVGHLTAQFRETHCILNA
jgi:hypothetical protein